MKLKSYKEWCTLNEASQKFKLNLPKEVKELHKLFQKNHFKLYVVGGAVRDAILGKKPHDYDVATDATPTQIEKMIAGKYKTIDGGKSKDLGVTIAIINGEPFEIATFRQDKGKGRRPDGGVEFTTIDKDVLRRDLTINALFYDIDNQEIVDLVGGVSDLHNKKIKTVGDAEQRFNEDPLRKLRAIRFAGAADSEPDIAIDKALLKDNTLTGVSAERIQNEFKKTIAKAKDTKYPLSLLQKYGFFSMILPGYNINTEFVNSNKWIILLAQLLKFNDDNMIKKLTKHKYSTDDVRDIIFLKEFFSLTPETVLAVENKWNIAQFGSNKIKSFDLLKFAKWNDMNIKVANAFLKFKPTVKGDEIMKEYGIKGKAVGIKKNELEAENFQKLL
jgi:tRNA nucleotidyltransferase/poly(A) polymerase